MTPVKMSDRTGILTLQEHERVIVEPCQHDHLSYVNNGTNHSWSCNDCATTIDAEDHTYGDPVWNWADDLSAATAVFLCPCGYSFNIQTTSIEVKDYFHKNVYAANVEYSGKTYTNTVEVAKSDIMITNESDWGEFIQIVNDGTTFAGQTITLTNDISVTTMAGTDTHKFMGTFEGGGLLGWPYDKTVSFTNCLNIGTFETDNTDCGTFSRTHDSSNLTITSSYYQKAYGTEQGTQTYATGNELKALLGDGWVIYGSKAVPKCFTTTPCYTVTWKNDNGTVIDTVEVKAGDAQLRSLLTALLRQEYRKTR